jgi:hypothetical protein
MSVKLRIKHNNKQILICAPNLREAMKRLRAVQAVLQPVTSAKQ